MRTHLLILLILLTSFIGPADAKLNVVATTTDIAALVEIVGGDHVEVEALCRGYQDPHYLEAKPSHMARLRKADLLVYVGLELEVGWLPLLVNGSRNPRLRAGNPGSLSCASDIDVLEVPTGEVSRSEGDVHPLGNPHYYLSPRNQLVMAGTIARRLAELDAEHAEAFESNLAAFTEKMETAIAGWEERVAGWRGRQIVCYHQQWEYLLDWLGIGVLAYVENKPGIPPSPQHLSGLKQTMTREQIPIVLISNFFEPAHARRVAEASEAEVIILPAAIDGEDGLSDPFLYFGHVIDALEAALPDGGERG